MRQPRYTEPMAEDYIDKAIRLMKRMIRQSKSLRVKVIQARLALADLVAASKYTWKPMEEED